MNSLFFFRAKVGSTHPPGHDRSRRTMSSLFSNRLTDVLEPADRKHDHQRDENQFGCECHAAFRSCFFASS